MEYVRVSSDFTEDWSNVVACRSGHGRSGCKSHRSYRIQVDTDRGASFQPTQKNRHRRPEAGSKVNRKQ